MADNHPEDKYLYEIIVETGPKDSHATTAKIYFILAGNDEETDVRFENSFFLIHLNMLHVFKQKRSTPHPLRKYCDHNTKCP